MAKEPYFLGRKALYIKVWETPTVKLAKEFGVSDVAIAKMCKRLNVPKPPLGYWRRIETGSKKKIPPLSKPDDSTKPGIWIYPKSEEQTLMFEEEYKKQDLAIEQKIAEKLNAESFPEITVSEALRKPHPLIIQTQKAFSKKETDIYGALFCSSWKETHISLRISENHFNRALRIMDALIKALEKLGGEVSIEKDRRMLTEVRIDDIKLHISLKEDFKRFERELSAAEKKSEYVSDRYYYEPTGSFTFTAEGVYGIRGNWRDGKTASLEDQLNDIVIGIFRTAEACRRKEIELKQEERRQVEFAVEQEKRKLLRKKEIECRDHLERLSEQWERSRRLFNFLKEYEANLIDEKGEILPDSDEAQLIKWGCQHAARLNPLLNNQVSELLE